MAITETQKKIDALWEKMWNLKDTLELESEFAKLAESNFEMRELWSEYSMRKGLECTIKVGNDSGVSAASTVPVSCISVAPTVPVPSDWDCFFSYLPNKEDYFLERQRIAIGSSENKEWSEPLFFCPQCGGTVRRNEAQIFMSNPPRYLYACDNCEWQDRYY